MKIKTLVLILMSVGLLYAQQLRDSIIINVHVPSISVQTPIPNLPVFTGILKGDPGYIDSQAISQVRWSDHYVGRIVFSFPHVQPASGDSYIWKGYVSIKPLSGYKITPDSIFESIYSRTGGVTARLIENYTAEVVVSTIVQHQYNLSIIRSNELSSKQYDLMGRLKNYSSGIYIQNHKSILIIKRLHKEK